MATVNDRAVLNVIFNPELPTTDLFEDDQVDNQGEGDIVPSPSLDIDASILDKVKSLEKEAVVAAEDGKLSTSLDLLNQAIEVLPVKPSLFNNRAQVFQLLGQTEEAIDDLNEAIKLTNGKGSVAMNAFTQRALIRIKLNGFSESNFEAIDDLKCGQRLGSDFCKKLLIKFNPYSALCNQMLNDMMKELKQ